MISTAKKKLQLGVVLIFLAALAVSFTLMAQAQSTPSTPSPVANWRPNHSARGWRFLGSKACAECHAAKFKTQTATHMSRALFSPETADILRTYPRLTFRNGQYNYLMTRDGNRMIYAVNDGVNTLSAAVFYVFGDAEMGQTYVLQYQDKYYESRVSFYSDIKGLDITMGHAAKPPATLGEALGREMKIDETRACFACHSTNAVDGNNLHLDQLMEGVTCEACHGPGEKHVAAMRAGEMGQKEIFNPKKLATEDLFNFCGTCHRTWDQVAIMGLRGVQNVRFQPYRLTNSKCYDPEDKRISCLACHDPHEARKRDAAFFDSKCAACHRTTPPAAAAVKPADPRTAPPCPVGKANCVSCHMPKVEIPNSHFHFSDHQIRILRPGAPYPN